MHFCTEVQHWINPSTDNPLVAPPTPDLCAHVAQCYQCRTALLLQATELLQVPLDIVPTSCAACQDDLAAYIDIEQTEGLQAAIQAYPHLWWHLWICANCAETYRGVEMLQQAEELKQITPLSLDQLVGHRQPLVHTVTLPRRWLASLLAPHYGVAWGDRGAGSVIHEEEDEGRQITVSMQKQAGAWSIHVAITPPIAGDLLVTLGDERFRATIDPNGVATVGPIPSQLLQQSAGPDMTIQIEPFVR